MDTRTSKLIDDFRGVWQRLVIASPGECCDTHTHVEWMQSGEFFVDLREPATARPEVKCLAEVDRSIALAMASYEGFAGIFSIEGELGLWSRQIDFQPPLSRGDRGYLSCHNDLVIETGADADYVEHWQRPPFGGSEEAWALTGQISDDGRAVTLVRIGHRFGWARARAEALPMDKTLAELVMMAKSDEEIRQLIDCEISTGVVLKDRWIIQRSTHPWRIGDTVFTGTLDAKSISINDRSATGEEVKLDIAVHMLTNSAGQIAPSPPAANDSLSLPVINISSLDGGDPEAEQAVIDAIKNAACDSGFFYITGHGIAPAVIEGLKSATRRFFDQPYDFKMESYIGNSWCHRGYVPEGEEGFDEGKHDKKEAFDLSIDLPDNGLYPRTPLTGPNQWPALPGFRENIMAYYGAVFAVGRRLLRGFAQALDLPKDYFDQYVTYPPSQLRLIHYPYDDGASDASGIGAHTDYECFTLLLPTAPGLELLNMAGEWMDVPLVDGAFVINIGDMLEYWSGGRFVATSHRVRRVAEERYSFPLFFAVDYDTRILPINGQTDGEPLCAGEHLHAQTIQTFSYLKQRVARGELVPPAAARPLLSFGQLAKAQG
jgi:isopenicillin N synthase-like dioxygenase